ncbi:MBL fold metallo-hydrolase [Nocardioides maradonensis]
MSAPTIITPDDVVEPRLEEVADGIFAYLQLYGQWGLNNAGFLVGSKRTIAIDTCFTVSRSRAFRDQIEQVTSSPISTLLNTHHHGDHTYGNFLFPEATIVGHELCREEVVSTGLTTTALFQDGVDWGDIEIDPPFVTFSDKITLHSDAGRVEAIYVGPAHTTNDVVYYLPERKLIFSGDVAFAGGTPFALMGSVSGSLLAYERLRELDVETVVPGHGPVCGPEVFDDMASYLAMVQDAAVEAHAAGISALEAARSVDLGRYAEWHDSERIVGNLHRSMAEQAGLPAGGQLDLGPAIADMVVLNGGQPLHCLA